MDESRIKTAEQMARIFLQRIKEYRAREAQEERSKARCNYRCCTTKEGGALRRASMELTRALADLRRSVP